MKQYEAPSVMIIYYSIYEKIMNIEISTSNFGEDYIGGEDDD